jgi:hypothetical protein
MNHGTRQAGAQVCSCILEILKGCPVERALHADLERAADRLGIYQLGETPRPERGLGVKVTRRGVRF